MSAATEAPGADAILRTLHAATPTQVQRGSAWYQVAHTFALGLAERYELPGGAAQAAYVIAALSPQQSWSANQQSADLLIRTGSTFGLGANVAKARRILAGESPHTVLAPPNPARITGSKVRAFAECILANGKTSTVCVDRHAADVALGRPIDAKPLPAGFLTAHRYGILSAAYRQAAQRTGGQFTACEVQAITWITRREDKYRPGAFG